MKRRDHAATPPGPSEDYAIALTLKLPRDELSVPVIRHLARDTLCEIGTNLADVHDVELALSEACANVLDHAGPGDAYDVSVTVRAEWCELRIVDVGHGFDQQEVTDQAGMPQQPWRPHAERGRGLALMHALMDSVDLVSEPERGTLVTLTKQLTFDERSPARTLLAQALRGNPTARP